MKRFYITSLLAIGLAAAIAAIALSQFEHARLVKDSKIRARAILAGIEDSIRTHYDQKKMDRIARVARKIGGDPNVYGIALCIHADQGSKSVGFPAAIPASTLCSSESELIRHDSHRLQLHSQILDTRAKNERVVLLMAYDTSKLSTLWAERFFRTLALVWFGGLLVFLLVTTQIRRFVNIYMKFLHQSLRALIAGKRPPSFLGSAIPLSSHLAPISRDIDSLARKILTLPRADQRQQSNAPHLLQSLKETIGNRNVVVYANREPYIHQHKGDKIEVVRPASGLVTALEPILRQCGGLWIGHGSGTADREMSNASGEVQVPPHNPSYKLKRIWLSQEEEMGYYYGFSNEGLWPLCHLAHNRPTFRLSDWEKYGAVNQRFCDETPAEALETQSIILVQDYHFALLPRMIKKRAEARSAGWSRPESPRVGLFWHIPWPNPEAFGICPWGKELLLGMLGADVIGFHTQYHCNNFLETCDRFLEARIDWERFSVTRDHHETQVKAFPIGIDTPAVRTLNETERKELKKRYGIQAEFVAVGVDRLDYTKGLTERVEAVERFLEKNPSYIGRFSLVQVGSPSRTHIPAYRALAEQLEAAVNRVNARFGSAQGVSEGYQPVHLIAHHHEWDDIQYFYQLGDICMVTSLHDGMNLVAKEYIWCQQPERGSLILSKFTGACRELTDAFIVNPYSTEEMADAIFAALTQSPEERTRRMQNMRKRVEEHNAFRWASELIKALVPDAQPIEFPTVRPTSIFKGRGQSAQSFPLH